MRITSKGQVTIPIDIRQRAGLRPNSEVEFRFNGEVVTLHPVEGANHGQNRGQLIVQHLRQYRGTMTMPAVDLLALTRGE